MIVCRCGHGRHHHRASRGARKASCRYLWRVGGWKVCKCRDYVPASLVVNGEVMSDD